MTLKKSPQIPHDEKYICEYKIILYCITSLLNTDNQPSTNENVDIRTFTIQLVTISEVQKQDLDGNLCDEKINCGNLCDEKINCFVKFLVM